MLLLLGACPTPCHRSMLVWVAPVLLGLLQGAAILVVCRCRAGAAPPLLDVLCALLQQLHAAAAGLCCIPLLLFALVLLQHSSGRHDVDAQLHWQVLRQQRGVDDLLLHPRAPASVTDVGCICPRHPDCFFCHEPWHWVRCCNRLWLTTNQQDHQTTAASQTRNKSLKG